MKTVTVRDLRNRGGEVLEQVAAGEPMTVTKDGRAVAELRPVRAPGLPAERLLERWRRVPAVDAQAFRADVDAVLDPGL